jgi:hypothetical protein
VACFNQAQAGAEIEFSIHVGILAPHLPGEEDRRAVYGNRIVNLPGITAGHGDGDRDLPAAAMRENPAIPFDEASHRQPEAAQAVILVRIGAGQVNDEFRAGDVEGGIEAFLKPQEIGVVGTAIGQFNIEIALFLLEWKIARAVDRERENAFVTGQNAGSAIALMDVTIHNQYPACLAFSLHGAGSNGGIIENAKSFTAITKGVVRAAGEIGRNAIPQRCATGADGGASRATGTFDHAFAPRKANRFLRLFWQLTVTNLLDVVSVMGACQFFIAGGMWQMKIGCCKFAAGQQGFTKTRIFLHRETMAGGERENEDIGVEKFHEGR